MAGENFVQLGMVAAAFFISLLISFLLGKIRSKSGLAIMGLLWAGFTGILFFGMYNENGWGAIGYLVLLVGISAPAGVGGLIGGPVGWMKGDNVRHNKPTGGAGPTDT